MQCHNKNHFKIQIYVHFQEYIIHLEYEKMLNLSISIYQSYQNRNSSVFCQKTSTQYCYSTCINMWTISSILHFMSQPHIWKYFIGIQFISKTHNAYMKWNQYKARVMCICILFTWVINFVTLSSWQLQMYAFNGVSLPALHTVSRDWDCCPFFFAK